MSVIITSFILHQNYTASQFSSSPVQFSVNGYAILSPSNGLRNFNEETPEAPPPTPTEIQSTKLANFVREMYKNPLSCPVATGVATPVSEQKKEIEKRKIPNFLKRSMGKC